MPPHVEIVLTLMVTVLCSVMASSGFWAYFQNKHRNKDSRLDLLLGLAHDRIIHVGKGYLKRGYISYDELEDYQKYLYSPYAKFGGNGLAEQMYKEVLALPHYPTKKVKVKVKEPKNEQPTSTRPDPYCLNFQSSDEH